MNARSTLISFALALCFIIVPNIAFAYTLQCTDGLPSGGTIFLGVENCNGFGLDQPFSSLNCYFKQILNEVVTKMYCGIQYELGATLKVVILLFVLMYALMFTLGLAALTAKELVTRLIKIALVWTFATNASWGVGLALYFFIGSIETMVTWVVGVFFGSMGGLDFIAYIDYLIFNQLTGSFTTDGFALIGFFITLSYLMFPVFLLFLVYMMTVMAALTRTVVSYLLGLSGIAFLISLSPIFVSFALFKPTYTFFDSWLKYLVSFALQIVLVFAAVALWLFVMSLTDNFFIELASRIVPYKDIAHTRTSFAFFQDTWGLCKNGAETGFDLFGNTFKTGRCICSSPSCEPIDFLPMSPSEYAADQTIMAKITSSLIGYGALVYAFDALIRMMPHLARQLAGPAFAPQLGGGTGFGSIQMPGFSMIGQAKEGLMYQAKTGAFSWFNKQRNAVGSTMASNTALDRVRQKTKANNEAMKAAANKLATGGRRGDSSNDPDSLV